MKVVINKDYGGFSIPDRWAIALNIDRWLAYKLDRTNPKLVELVETNPSENCHLVVVHIPDDVTDYIITEHDGLETLHFVIDGKIHSVSPGYEDDEDDDQEDEE